MDQPVCVYVRWVAVAMGGWGLFVRDNGGQMGAAKTQTGRLIKQMYDGVGVGDMICE